MKIIVVATVLLRTQPVPENKKFHILYTGCSVIVFSTKWSHLFDELQLRLNEKSCGILWVGNAIIKSEFEYVIWFFKYVLAQSIQENCWKAANLYVYVFWFLNQHVNFGILSYCRRRRQRQWKMPEFLLFLRYLVLSATYGQK